LGQTLASLCFCNSLVRYAENTEFEELALEYLNDFSQQFSQVYPDRHDPYVSCRNELGVRKPLCSFIRPCKLPFKELYDLGDCARFFSDFVMYEQLQDPLRLCDYAASAQTTINWQAGDCLDMSILLCSVLIGYGFDAYVVRGYVSLPLTSTPLISIDLILSTGTPPNTSSPQIKLRVIPVMLSPSSRRQNVPTTTKRTASIYIRANNAMLLKNSNILQVLAARAATAALSLHPPPEEIRAHQRKLGCCKHRRCLLPATAAGPRRRCFARAAGALLGYGVRASTPNTQTAHQY
jgi:hypothetical protein